MAVQKNFVVHNGLEVNQNLIYADSSLDKVGIRTTFPEYVLDVKGGIGAKDLKVTGITTVNNINFQGNVTAGSTTGKLGQYLVSTGTGVAWTAPPNSRQVTTLIATAGQSIFNLSYNIGFVDVYINGIRLSESEFTALDGFSITLDVPCFGDETVDFITYKNLTGSALNGITIEHDDVLVGTALSTIVLNFTGNAVDVNSTGVAATITINQDISQWVTTTAGIHTLSSVGIGTTNPNYALDVNGTTRITGFIESQNTSTNTNNILSLNAAQGTVFTHTTTANIGIVSFTGISTSKANTQKFTVLVTQGAVGYNTTAATGIGTQLATVVTEGGVGYSTHIKVGSGTTITLTSTPGSLDILTFIVSYNGVGVANTSFTVIGMNAQNFRGVI